MTSTTAATPNGVLVPLVAVETGVTDGMNIPAESSAATARRFMNRRHGGTT